MSWFRTWAQKHAALFGLTADQDLQAMLAWENLFIAAGYCAADLDEATAYLAGNPMALSQSPLRFSAGKMGAHRAALEARIRDRKAVTYQRTVEKEQDRGTCTLCNGSARVEVPHLAGVTDGEWVPMRVARGCASHYTMVVACPCTLGRWFYERSWATESFRGKVGLTLEEYEKSNPDWRLQLERRRSEDRERSALGPADKDGLGSALREIFARMGKERMDANAF